MVSDTRFTSNRLHEHNRMHFTFCDDGIFGAARSGKDFYTYTISHSSCYANLIHYHIQIWIDREFYALQIIDTYIDFRE